ncbi:MAG: hypothetical protein OXG37_06730 [Actinomycetia bacterium]|nr:hypothetical protein [Actinomycetes bacterium]
MRTLLLHRSTVALASCSRVRYQNVTAGSSPTGRHEQTDEQRSSRRRPPSRHVASGSTAPDRDDQPTEERCGAAREVVLARLDARAHALNGRAQEG